MEFCKPFSTQESEVDRQIDVHEEIVFRELGVAHGNTEAEDTLLFEIDSALELVDSRCHITIISKEHHEKAR